MAPDPKFKNTFATHLKFDTITQFAGAARKDIDPGKSISVTDLYLCNDGDEGKCALQVWEWNKSKSLKWAEKTLKKAACISDGDVGSFKLADSGYINGDNVDISLIAYYWDGSKWVQNDSFGCKGSRVINNLPRAITDYICNLIYKRSY
jgi:hypothetical protein